MGDLADGRREVVSRRWLVGSLAAFAFGNLAFAAFFVLGPLVVERDLGGAPAWGLLMSAFGFGGLAGGAIALRWRPERPLGGHLHHTPAGPGRAAAAGADAAAGGPGRGGLMLAVFIAICNTLWHTTLQQQVPAEQHLPGQLLRLDGLAPDLPGRCRAGRSAGRCLRRRRGAVRVRGPGRRAAGAGARHVERAGGPAPGRRHRQRDGSRWANGEAAPEAAIS